jgi:hypothetical protein
VAERLGDDPDVNAAVDAVLAVGVAELVRVRRTPRWRRVQRVTTRLITR